MSDLLRGRLAFVTGAGQGIGRAIALGLAEAGARVVITDLRGPEAEETAGQIRIKKGEAWSYSLDVTDDTACQVLSHEIKRDIGDIDLLVNCAGILVREGIDSIAAAKVWRNVINVNLNGPFNVTQALLPMLRATKGTILNIASLASFVGLAGALGYAPSKGALKLYTQSLAAELAIDGVRVNAIAPGLIATPMNAEAFKTPGYLSSRMVRTPLGRPGQVEDLVGPAVFLSSSMSSYITGITLPVDGGFLAV